MLELYLAFTSFILAYFALINRVKRFSLEISYVTSKKLLCLFCVNGIIVLVNQNFEVQIPLVQTFMMLFLTISLIFTVIYLFYIFIGPSLKISGRNAEKYFDGCRKIISSGIKKDNQLLTEEITNSNSIPIIFDSAINGGSGNINKYSVFIIGLFSDLAYCKVIVKHNPEAIISIFTWLIQNCEKVHGDIFKLTRNFINRLLLLMFTESESVLQREERYHGLGHFREIKNLIFGSSTFLKSQFHPLQIKFSFCDRELTQKAIDKYFEIFEYSLEIYLEDGDNYPDIFGDALNNLADTIRDDVWKKGSGSKIFYITGVAIHIIGFIKHHPELFPIASMLSEDEEYFDRKRSENIYDSLAKGIFHVIETLAVDPQNDEGIRLLVCDIDSELYEDNEPLQAFRERLYALFKEEIESSLKANTPACSPLIRSLIYSWGLCEPEVTRNKLHKFLLEKLKYNFIAIYNAFQDKIARILPDDTEYDEKAQKLIRKHHIRWRLYRRTEDLTLER